MAKELPYFKFEPAEWLAGRISLEPYEIQGAYISICSLYWQKLSEITERDAKLRIGSDLLSKLIDKEFIVLDKDYISIKWLDAQLEERKVVSEKRRKAGAKGGKANATKSKANANQVPSKKKQKRIEENREEENRIEDNEVDLSLPPTLDSVEKYFIDNGYTKESAKKAFDYYNASLTGGKRKWTDSKGNVVKNWKQKMRSVWFKEENKVKPKASSDTFVNSQGQTINKSVF